MRIWLNPGSHFFLEPTVPSGSDLQGAGF